MHMDGRGASGQGGDQPLLVRGWVGGRKEIIEAFLSSSSSGALTIPFVQEGGAVAGRRVAGAGGFQPLVQAARIPADPVGLTTVLGGACAIQDVNPVTSATPLLTHSASHSPLHQPFWPSGSALLLLVLPAMADCLPALAPLSHPAAQVRAMGAGSAHLTRVAPVCRHACQWAGPSFFCLHA